MTGTMNSDEKRLWVFARASEATEGAAAALEKVRERLGLPPASVAGSRAIVAEPWSLLSVVGPEVTDALAPHLVDTANTLAERLRSVVVLLWVDPGNDAARLVRAVPPDADRSGMQSFSGRRRSVVEESSLYLGLAAAAIWPLLGRPDEAYPGDLLPATEEERFVDEKLREARNWMRRYLESKGADDQGRGR